MNYEPTVCICEFDLAVKDSFIKINFYHSLLICQKTNYVQAEKR